VNAVAAGFRHGAIAAGGGGTLTDLQRIWPERRDRDAFHVSFSGSSATTYESAPVVKTFRTTIVKSLNFDFH
jgi:hypothetical protein